MIDSSSVTSSTSSTGSTTSSSADPIQDAEHDLLDTTSSSARLWIALYAAGAIVTALIGYLLVESVSFHNSTAAGDLTTIASTITPIAAAVAFAWSSRPPGSSAK